MQQNVVLGLLVGTIAGAGVAMLTLPQWQHLITKRGTLASYATCIERFQGMDDIGAIARKSCKAQNVKKLRYGQTTTFKGGLSRDFASMGISAQPNDTQDYERIEGTVDVYVDGKKIEEFPFTATSVSHHPSWELTAEFSGGEELKDLSWCSEDEPHNRCLKWTVVGLYGLTHK